MLKTRINRAFQSGYATLKIIGKSTSNCLLSGRPAVRICPGSPNITPGLIKSQGLFYVPVGQYTGLIFFTVRLFAII